MKTTKKLLAIAAFCVAGLSANAQAWGEQKVFSIGAGFGGSAFVASGTDATLPPIQVQLEFPTSLLEGKLGIGGLLGYAGSKYEFGAFKYKYSYILIGGRGNYHVSEMLGLPENIDAYGGLTLGYNVASVKWDGAGADPGVGGSAGGVLWGITAGGRYYFTDKIGANVELGYGISVLTLGLSVKL
ncbi:MAG: hypothetical protein WC150_09380 [Bacteroidia bacterium]